MDRSKFYTSLRAKNSGVFGTRIFPQQVSGMEAILDAAQARGTKLRHLAYMLSTAYHETARTMQPIEEYGKGKGRKYGVPTGPYGKVYYGRGLVQLTWLTNYEKAKANIGVDFVRYPERVMEPRLAAEIMFTGMAEGWFTGRKLSDYINETKTDYVSARRIINGTDKAAMIAGYAKAFETALVAGGYVAQAPKPSPVPPPVPPVAVPPVSKDPEVVKPAPEAGKGGKKGALAIFISIIIAAVAAYFGIGAD